jgi:signal transduction histidine kinase
VSQSVLQASSREDIERIVCERFADSDPYVLAWIGKVAEETPAVRPEVSAGIDQRYLDAVALDATLDDDADHGYRRPVREAIETGSVQVQRATTVEEGFDADVNADRYAVVAVPLAYENRTYGVLSVWSDQRHAFGETERRVLSKFGNSLAYAIDSVQTRKELVRREQRLQVFNRILRHNLRNDLNVVLGRAENIAEEFPPAEQEASVIKQKASELIEISEKAREVGKTLDRENRTKKQIDLTDCVERTCTEFRQNYPDAEIVTDVPDSVRVYADKTLEAAISELIENAIEHNDGAPSVTVMVSATEDDREWLELTVLDDGPGIPKDEREVLAEGEETALHHGSGLGLWLTNWIVGKFGGELSFDDYHASGGAVTLRLQRAVEDDASTRDVSTLRTE